MTLEAKVKQRIKEDFGKTWSQLKKDIKSSHDASEFSCSDHFKGTGYHIFYTSNSNYMQGARNGGGIGYFANVRFVGMSKTVKLS